MEREQRTNPGTVPLRPSTDHAGHTLADLTETVRAMRRRDAVTEGVPTFLLLEEYAGSASPGRPSAEDRALAGLARTILDRLTKASDTGSAADAIDAVGAAGGNARDHHPSLREKIPLTLEALGALRFAPDSEGPGPEEVVGSGRADGDSGPAADVAAAFLDGRYVRAVNFHSTPRRFAGRLEAQLSWLAERFAPVGYDDLLGLADGWPHAKPPLILSFFDGRRDNFEVAAPMVERLGLVGWFFVVSGWVATPPDEQRDFARRNDIALSSEPAPHEASDDRLAMTPEEVGALAGRGHIVACHTRSHAAVSPDMALAEIECEVKGSKGDLERPLGGGSVRAFAWREGSPLGTDARADRLLREAGYELLFANHVVQRVR